MKFLNKRRTTSKKSPNSPSLSFPPQFNDISINHFKNVIELANNEILKDEKLPMGNIVSERASRPLISEKSSEVRKEAIQQKAKY
jgi:hypothetical protein